MEDNEVDEVITDILNTDPSDFVTMATMLLDAFEETGYGSGKIDTDEEGHKRLTLHTGGWSACEDIIWAIQDFTDMPKTNLFWVMYWYQSTRGGHYVFVDCIKRG